MPKREKEAKPHSPKPAVKKHVASYHGPSQLRVSNVILKVKQSSQEAVSCVTEESNLAQIKSATGMFLFRFLHIN